MRSALLIAASLLAASLSAAQAMSAGCGMLPILADGWSGKGSDEQYKRYMDRIDQCLGELADKGAAVEPLRIKLLTAKATLVFKKK
jgi:hypothetical protein